ncbi:MAG: tetratricopeptide repeat protein [Melioribacteraceae bacterium]|nr:tetratricopeptide repeat protein [Melioribacteraceae bacterium]
MNLSLIYKIIIAFLIFSWQVIAQQQNLDNKYRLAESYERSNQLENAERLYLELFTLQPTNYTFFESLNRVLINQKKYERSIHLLQTRLNENPMDINLYGMMGLVYKYQNNSAKADSIWEAGIRTNPNQSIIYRVISNYAIESRDYSKAIEVLTRGKRNSGESFMFSLDLANIYAANMKYREAAEEYCEILKLRPDQNQYIKSRITNFITRPDAAQQIIEIFKKNLNSIHALYDIVSSVYLAIGNYEEAFKTTIEGERKLGKDGTMIYILAQELYRNKVYSWSAKVFEYLIDNYPASINIMPSKLGYAKTLESSIKEKEITENEWLPIRFENTKFRVDYENVIRMYLLFAESYRSNAARVEALFNAAEILRTKFSDYEQSDSLYKLILIESPTSIFALNSNIGLAKNSISLNNLSHARNFLEQAFSNSRYSAEELNEAKFISAKIDFWEGKFSDASIKLVELVSNFQMNFTNDAIELTAVITAAKSDSLSLLGYAKSDLFLFQNKPKEALVELKTLADNPNLLILNEFAQIKIVEIFLAMGNFIEAEDILKSLIDDEKTTIFDDKSTFLIAQLLFFCKKDNSAALEYYQKLLAKFPNSLYFDRARTQINFLNKNLNLK